MYVNVRTVGVVGVTAAVWLWLAAATLAAAPDFRLVTAAQARDLAQVRGLLKAGADVNAPRPDGATALMWAAHWADVEMAQVLLRAGANPNAADDQEVTPLILACETGDDAIVGTRNNEAATDRMVEAPRHLHTIGGVAGVEGIATVAVAVRKKVDDHCTESAEVEAGVRQQHRVEGPAHLRHTVLETQGALRQLQCVPDSAATFTSHHADLMRMEVNAATPTEPTESKPDGIRIPPRDEQTVSADGHTAQQVAWWHDLRPPDAFHRATKLIEFIGGAGRNDAHRSFIGGHFSIVMRCLDADHPKCSP